MAGKGRKSILLQVGIRLHVKAVMGDQPGSIDQYRYEPVGSSAMRWTSMICRHMEAADGYQFHPGIMLLRGPQMIYIPLAFSLSPAYSTLACQRQGRSLVLHGGGDALTGRAIQAVRQFVDSLGGVFDQNNRVQAGISPDKVGNDFMAMVIHP